MSTAKGREQILASAVAGKLSMELREVLELHNISLDAAVETMLPQDIAQNMITENIYISPEERSAPGIEDYNDAVITNILNLRDGKMSQYFDQAGGEASKWHNVQMAWDKCERNYARIPKQPSFSWEIRLDKKNRFWPSGPKRY